MDTTVRPTRRALRLAVALLVAAVLAVAQVSSGTQAASSAQVISRVNTGANVIALTFDCGSDRGYAESILNALRDKDVRASFGVEGLFAQQNPDLVRRMAAEGHQIINHTWDHLSWTGYSTPGQPAASTSAARASELSRTDNLIYSLTGEHTKPYFRPPFGDYDQSVLADLAANGYNYSVMWTQNLDTMGWNGASVSQITQRVLTYAAPGAIVLMHVGSDSLDAAALPRIIDQLRARGVGFDTVANLTGDPGPTPRYFAETGHSIGGGFQRYWEAFGGLKVFGFPITHEFQENGYTVQYFERARFEWHPGAIPSRYDVLLGLLGNQIAQYKGLPGTSPFQRITGANDANCTYYPETGHTLCFGFRDFWNSHGGLMIYGYPVSQEFQVNGMTVQYFERQRLEWHPQNPPAWQVLGGLVGSEVYDATH